MPCDPITTPKPPTTPGFQTPINHRPLPPLIIIDDNDIDNHNTNSTNQCLSPRNGSPPHAGTSSPTHQWHPIESSHETLSWSLPKGEPPPPHLKGLEHAKEILGKLSSPLSIPTLERDPDAPYPHQEPPALSTAPAKGTNHVLPTNPSTLERDPDAPHPHQEPPASSTTPAKGKNHVLSTNPSMLKRDPDAPYPHQEPPALSTSPAKEKTTYSPPIQVRLKETPMHHIPTRNHQHRHLPLPRRKNHGLPTNPSQHHQNRQHRLPSSQSGRRTSSTSSAK